MSCIFDGRFDEEGQHDGFIPDETELCDRCGDGFDPADLIKGIKGAYVCRECHIKEVFDFGFSLSEVTV